MASDDGMENWDEEFGITTSNESLSLKLATAPPTQEVSANKRGSLFGMDDADTLSDEDWTGDFASTAPQKILGIQADPNAKEEDWDEDFEFNNDNSEDGKALIPPVRTILSRTRSNTQIQPNQAAINLAEELLASIPSEDELFLLDVGPVQPKEKVELPEVDFISKTEERNTKLEKAKDDKVAASRAYWDLGLLYETYNKVVPAMTEFQHALQLLQEAGEEKEVDSEYEMMLYYHMGLAAKAMADIFQQTEYFENAIKIAQTDKKFLPQFTHMNLELGISHLLTENHFVALRYLEAHLRSVLYAHCTATAPGHVHINACINNDLVDWRAACTGCLSVGKAMKALDQTEIALGYFEKAHWLASEVCRELKTEILRNLLQLKDKEVEKASKVQLEELASKKAPKSAEQVQKPIVTSTPRPRPPEEEEAEEDWDAELGIEAEPEERPVLRLPGQLPTVAGTPRTERVPLRYKLLESVSSQPYEIVKFPKPTFLYTLHTTSGHVFMHEEELEQWLKNVLARHIRTGTPALHAKEKVPLPELRNFYSTAMATVTKGSKKWAILCVEFCYIIYLHGHLELCWDSIHGFFRDLHNIPPSTPEKDVLFDFSFHLLYLASKLWKPEEDEPYQFMLKVQQQLAPQHSYLVDVLAAETYSHHLHHKSPKGNALVDTDSDSSEDEGPASKVAKMATPKGLRKDSTEEKDEAKTNPLATLCKAYAQCKNQLSEEVERPAISKSKAMSVGRLAETFHPKCILARAIVDVHFHLNGISPLTTARLGMQDSVRALTKNLGGKYEQETQMILHQPAERMRLLTELYPSVPISHLKAKVAFALAEYATSCENYFLAEKQYFEAIYILDLCRPVVDGMPSILSELGASALLGYADVLLRNFKYQYAIMCFEATMVNMQLREKEKEYQVLLQRVAAICRENDDLKRSVVLYRDILHACCSESKINEVIYVSETLASLHQERGEFPLAEAYLLAASLALRKNSPQTDRMDPLYFQLQLKLAHLYLESFNFERGIELLERLNRGDMPHSKKSMLLADLAKAYIKKEWTDECSNILSKIEGDDRPTTGQKLGHTPSGRNSAVSFSSTQSAREFMAGGSGGGGDLAKHLKYWHLLTLNNYHSNRFPEAIASIECAIELCPQSSLKSRGQFFYLRGKVFQGLCTSASSTVINFPTNLRPTEEWKETVHYPHPTDNTTPVTYTCTGDIVQECVASYRKAYQYFKTIGDDLQIAKTVSRIAEAYLGRVFAPVALLHYPYDDISRSPTFQLSHTITKDKTGDTGEPDEKEKRKDQDEKGDKRKDDVKKASAGLKRSRSDTFEKEFSITLESIESPAKVALDICADMCNLALMMRKYVTP